MRNEDEDEDEEELLMMLIGGNAIKIVESDVNNCVLSRDILMMMVVVKMVIVESIDVENVTCAGAKAAREGGLHSDPS